MKKWIVRLTIVFLLLTVIAAVAVFFSLNSLVKSGFEKVGPMVTKTEVKLESANLSPFSGNGELHGLFVGNPEGYQTASAIKVRDIRVNLRPKTVLSDVVLVQSVEINEPEITFEGGLTGSNIKKLLDNISAVAGASKDKSKTDKPAEGGKRLKIEVLTVKNAKVNVSLKGLRGKSATVSIPDIHLTNIGMGQDGVSTAEVSRQVIKEILEGILKAIPKIIGDLGGQLKDLGTKAADTAEPTTERTTKGIKGLFKK